MDTMLFSYIYQYIQRARWFHIQDSKKKLDRYELVYVIEYVDHRGVKKEQKKYVDIRRMNHQIWKHPKKLKSGFLRIKDHTKVKPPIMVSYTASDIEWFLKWGMDSFLKYNAQVM